MLACGGIWWGFEGEQVNQDLEGEERGSGDLFTTNSGYRCSYDYITAHVIYNIQYILFTERSHSHHHISATSLRNARLASHPPCDAHAVPMRHDNLCAPPHQCHSCTASTSRGSNWTFRLGGDILWRPRAQLVITQPES